MYIEYPIHILKEGTGVHETFKALHLMDGAVFRCMFLVPLVSLVRSVNIRADGGSKITNGSRCEQQL